MTMDQNGASQAQTAPQSGVVVAVNAPELVTRYTRDGVALQVPADQAARLEQDLGLLPVKYDLEAAISEWHALFDAKRDAVLKSLEEMTALGYERDETGWILSTAHSNERAAFEHLLYAIGAILPTEGQVRDVAAHRAEHGNLDQVPGLAKLEALADRYAEQHPVQPQPATDQQPVTPVQEG